MKTAYELAMERLSKQAPTVQLTDAQKRQLAELDSLYAAKIAELEVMLQGVLAKAEAMGDLAAIEEAQGRLSQERLSLRAELEEKKERVRQGKA